MPLLEQVLKQYPKEARIVLKNYPLPNHEYAKKAAIAALAAYRQGKFWEMQDILYKNAKELEDKDLKKYAEKIELNVEQFEKDFN